MQDNSTVYLRFIWNLADGVYLFAVFVLAVVMARVVQRSLAKLVAFMYGVKIGEE